MKMWVADPIHMTGIKSWQIVVMLLCTSTVSSVKGKVKGERAHDM